MAIKSINEALLVGFAGRDAETQVFQSGTKKTRISVATNRSWKDKNDEWQQETDWHYCEGWAKLAEKMAMIKKGDAVMIRGRVSHEKYTDRAGIEKNITKVIAISAEILKQIDTRGSQGGQPQQQPARQAPQNVQSADSLGGVDDYNDDIPF